MGCLKFWPAKRALSPSSSSILRKGMSLLGDTKTDATTFFAFMSWSCIFGADSPKELVVLGQTLRSARGSRLDLGKGKVRH